MSKDDNEAQVKDESRIETKVKDESKIEGQVNKGKPRSNFGFSLGGLSWNASKKKPISGLNDDTEPLAAVPKKPLVAVEPIKELQQEEGDPLEAYMVDVHQEVRRINDADSMLRTTDAPLVKASADNGEANESGNDSDGDFSHTDIVAAAAARLGTKRKELPVTDHSLIEYEPFRKDFYVEPPELSAMTDEEVDQKRLDLDGIRIRGLNCPKPVERWSQFGMSSGVLQVISRILKYDHPSPIQAQAIPAIMSGRDVIGIAKTGSGKTIAFLLPMFRHIKDQRKLQPGEGPIALLMTPTRELAVQIHRECRHFTSILGLRSVCCYGGAPISDQIADLKRGAEIVICTPGRMIDLLCANSGRVTNLKRVTYLVLDEADRMFDMGFEPQVMKMVRNVRPGRQTILFSATFPRKMEALARKILRKPLEITVGARSVVASDITQVVEVHDDDESKFLRLLEILGLWSTKDPEAKILIFTDRQDAADSMLNKLMRRGYPCQSLHGGKDQADRESTIADFKTGSSNILVATSVAARGLDVKQLKVVINYECPNHLEDYVHRVGRTGRAGNKGTAYTFITHNQDRFAIDISKALTMSGVPVPQPVQDMVDAFMEKIKTGSAHFSSSGFGGKGLEHLDKGRDIIKTLQKKSHGGDLVFAEDEDEEQIVDDDDDDAVDSAKTSVPIVLQPVTEQASGIAKTVSSASENAVGAKPVAATGGDPTKDPAKRVQELVASFKQKIKGIADSKLGSEAAFSCEIEINDYSQKARWSVTKKEQITELSEMTGAAITTRGTFIEKGKPIGPGERKLHLFIEADSQYAIDLAKTEIKRILTEATLSSMESEASGTRYLVL